MNIFQNDDYLYISKFIESKLPQLKEIEKYNKIYLENSNLIDELETMLKGEEREKLEKLVKAFYELEAYYFALTYSLGVKYGKDLEHL